MKNDKIPEGTVTGWLVTQGTWPNRTEFFCADTRRNAESWIAQRKDSMPKGAHIEKAHLIQLGMAWHRVYSTPIKCSVPLYMHKPKSGNKNFTGMVNPGPTTRTYVITHVAPPKPATWRMRLHMLLTGFVTPTKENS